MKTQIFRLLLSDEDREFLHDIRSEPSAHTALGKLRRYVDEHVRGATRELLKSNENLDEANRAKELRPKQVRYRTTQ